MSIKLVIVDDAPFIRESLKHILQGTEFVCVAEAASGEEAVEIVARTRPELVIMDMVMPVKNGIEATVEILQNHPRTKVVACTTEGQEEMVLRALQSGCCQFIRKPYTKDSVLTSLRLAMKESSLTRDK